MLEPQDASRTFLVRNGRFNRRVHCRQFFNMENFGENTRHRAGQQQHQDDQDS
jgi:hypothetical protein